MTTQHPAEIFFSSKHPITTFLKMQFAGVDDDVLTVELEAPAGFGDGGDAGRTHSGLAALVLDTVMGGAVLGKLEEIVPIATAGLTTQHMRRAKVGEKLRCIARYQGTHADMAHMTGELTSSETGELLSIATGSFMIGTRSVPLGPRV